MKTRMIYFRTELEQKHWSDLLSDKTGNRSLFDFYTLDQSNSLGQGQFGEVCPGCHIETGELVAIKTIQKTGMKVIQMAQ